MRSGERAGAAGSVLALAGAAGLVALTGGCSQGCTSAGPPSGMWLRADGATTDPYGVADLSVTACLRDQCRTSGLSGEAGVQGARVSGSLDLPPPTGPEPLDITLTVRRDDRELWGPVVVSVHPATLYPNGRDCGATYVGGILFDGTAARDDSAASAEAINQARAPR